MHLKLTPVGPTGWESIEMADDLSYSVDLQLAYGA